MKRKDHTPFNRGNRDTDGGGGRDPKAAMRSGLFFVVAVFAAGIYLYLSR